MTITASVFCWASSTKNLSDSPANQVNANVLVEMVWFGVAIIANNRRRSFNAFWHTGSARWGSSRASLSSSGFKANGGFATSGLSRQPPSGPDTIHAAAVSRIKKPPCRWDMKSAVIPEEGKGNWVSICASSANEHFVIRCAVAKRAWQFSFVTDRTAARKDGMAWL